MAVSAPVSVSRGSVRVPVLLMRAHPLYSAALSIDVSNYVSYNCRTPPEWRGPSGGMRRRIPPSVSPELREVGGVALCTGAQRKEIPVAGAAYKLASHSMCLITED